MYEFLDKTDTSKFWNFARILFAPIFFIIEYFVFKKYWYNIILPELIENEEIFEFLDNNDFAIKNNSLVKKDLVNEYEFLSGKSNEEIKAIIHKEFVLTVCNLIEKNVNQDIEEIINLYVDLDMHITKIDDDYVRNKIFIVCLSFCRLQQYNKIKNILIVWCIIFSIIIFCLYIMFFTNIINK